MTAATDLLRRLLVSYAERPEVAKVAVLGNAPLQPDERRAQDIDSADLVLRVNSFVLDDSEGPATQGRQVHAVVFNRRLRATPWFFDRYRERAYLMTEPARMYHPDLTRPQDRWPDWWPADLGYQPVPNREVAMPLCDAMDVPWREQRVVPTTGLLAAWLGLTLFPDAELVLAGFSFVDDPHQTHWSHQWGDSCPIGGRHWIAPEGRLMRSWLDSGRARLLR